MTGIGAKCSVCCWRARATLDGSGTSRTLRPLGREKHSLAHHRDLPPDVDDFLDEVDVLLHGKPERLPLPEPKADAPLDGRARHVD
ncbi:hypothetical protein SBADM41S_06998 [Streptomyces badius]